MVRQWIRAQLIDAIVGCVEFGEQLFNVRGKRPQGCRRCHFQLVYDDRGPHCPHCEVEHEVKIFKTELAGWATWEEGRV